MSIRFDCNDKERLVAYLYGEADDRERAVIDAHLAGCAACAGEVDGLRTVRLDLAAWQPPETDLGFRIVREPVTPTRRWWQVPAWAPAAVAAGLLLALAASLQIEYGNGTVIVRTGWAAPPAGTAVTPAPVAAPAAAPAEQTAQFQAALTALEARLRGEIAAARSGPATPVRAAASVDRAELLRRVQDLIDASERRQQRELAFRLAQAMQDVDTQRRSDMVRIETGLGQIEGLTGQEAARQRQLINYLMRTSQER
jgi:Putative zinc-finger